MRRIRLLVEDSTHQDVIGTLVERLAKEMEVPVQLDWITAKWGHGQVKKEFAEHVRNLTRGVLPLPDLIVIGTDANCKGLNQRQKEFAGIRSQVPVVTAIPDPHIERWLLLDGQAFHAVLGKGCDAPDHKCERGRYKRLLVEAALGATGNPTFSGKEHAVAIMNAINLQRAMQDESFKRFVEQIRAIFQGWAA